MAGWAAAGQAAGEIAGAGLNFLGGILGKKAAKKEARKQRGFVSRQAVDARSWQHEMYKRRYRMTMRDLEKAGLNPILAASAGGMTGGGFPSTGQPSSAAAQVGDFGQSIGRAGDKISRGVHSALEARQVKAQTDLTKAMEARTRAEAEVQKQEAWKRKMEAIASAYQPYSAATNQEKLIQEALTARATKEGTRASAALTKTGVPRAKAIDEYYRVGPGYWGAWLQEALQNIGVGGSARGAGTAAKIMRRGF